MKKLKHKIFPRAVVLGMTAFSMFIISCSADSPMKPPDEHAFTADQTPLSKKTKVNEKASNLTAGTARAAMVPDRDSFPQYATHNFVSNSTTKSYSGGQLTVPGGTKLKVESGALTPPAGTPDGADVTITMLVERDSINNELVFTFGPHGSQFNPPAEIWLDYSTLDIPVAKLYYIREDGQYILMHADVDDRQNKKMMLLIPHFSCYAIAHSR